LVCWGPVGIAGAWHGAAPAPSSLGSFRAGWSWASLPALPILPRHRAATVQVWNPMGFQPSPAEEPRSHVLFARSLGWRERSFLMSADVLFPYTDERVQVGFSPKPHEYKQDLCF